MPRKGTALLRGALIAILAATLSLSLPGCTVKPFDISGTVLDLSGNPVGGVDITADTKSAVTGSDGKYSIEGLAKAKTVVVPGKDGYLFDPPQLSVSGPSGSVNFTMVPGPKGVGILDIDIGLSFSAVLDTQGRVWTCGENKYGTLGDGTVVDKMYWVRSAGLDDAVDVTAGYGHVHALRSDGTVWGWGFAGSGRLGFSSPTLSVCVPTLVPGLAGITKISAGHYHTAALGSDGKVWAWGSNDVGQLGAGDTAPRSGPVQVSALSGIIDICAASDFTIALSGDGKVWAWGANSSGMLGNGGSTNSPVPVQVDIPADVVAIAAGTLHCLALSSNGDVWGWGSNAYGQADGKTTANVLVPGKIGITGTPTGISAGSASSFVFVPSGVYAWGGNGSGQLGDGSTQHRLAPALAENLSGMDWMVAKFNSCMAVDASGDLYAWGSNHKGQLCTGDTNPRYAPEKIVW